MYPKNIAIGEKIKLKMIIKIVNNIIIGTIGTIKILAMVESKEILLKVKAKYGVIIICTDKVKINISTRFLIILVFVFLIFNKL